MKRMTPPLFAKGRFTCLGPWLTTVDPKIIHTSVALRNFDDMEARSIDTLEDIYVANGLTETDFRRDEGLGAVIVTLQTDDGQMFYVPDTYIESFPDMRDVAYQHVVLSVSLGPTPEFLVLEEMQRRVEKEILESVGVIARTYVNIVPHSGAITPEEHELLEVNRVNNIRHSETDYTQLLRKSKDYDDLLERYQTLEQIVIENGLA